MGRHNKQALHHGTIGTYLPDPLLTLKYFYMTSLGLKVSRIIKQTLGRGCVLLQKQPADTNAENSS